MGNKKTYNINLKNDSEDLTYENWLAMFACIMNPKLAVNKALSIMGITSEKKIFRLKGGAEYES